MPIISTDIKLRLSGGAANSNVSLSLGGAKSSVEVVSAALHNLFDKVSSAEATAGSVEYRCIYVHNGHGTLDLEDARVFIPNNTPSADTTLAVGLGTAAVNATEQTVANEVTAPAGVSFSEPSTYAAGLAIGNLAAGAHKAIWLRRTITAGAAAVNDTATVRVQGDTAP